MEIPKEELARIEMDARDYELPRIKYESGSDYHGYKAGAKAEYSRAAKEIELHKNAFNALDKAHITASEQVQTLRNLISEKDKRISLLEDALVITHASLRTYGIHPLIDQRIKDLNIKPF